MNERWARFLFMILVGCVMGLFYGWVVNPVQYVDTPLESMRLDYKADYVLAVAEAYHVERDLNLAVQRLSGLGPSAAESVAKALEFGKNPELPPTSTLQAILMGMGVVEPLRTTPYDLEDLALMQALADALKIVSPAVEGSAP